MSLEEIYAEKIRALFTRKQARDLYDIYMMQGRTPSRSLVNEKLKYYSKEFNLEEAEERVEDLERIWEKELEPLVKEVPIYKEVKETVLKELEVLR